MGYIESNLMPDESLIYQAHLHWIIFLKAFFVIALGILLVVEVEWTIGSMIILLGLLFSLPPLILYNTSEFGITTKRVIIKVGFIQRRTLELLPRQVEAISIDQTILGRILGFGSVTLTGTGGVREVFHNIAAPLEFRRQIQRQVA